MYLAGISYVINLFTEYWYQYSTVLYLMPVVTGIQQMWFLTMASRVSLTQSFLFSVCAIKPPDVAHHISEPPYPHSLHQGPAYHLTACVARSPRPHLMADAPPLCTSYKVTSICTRCKVPIPV